MTTSQVELLAKVKAGVLKDLREIADVSSAADLEAVADRLETEAV